MSVPTKKSSRTPPHLHLIVGPMFSGKSTLLKLLMRRYKRGEKRVRLFKPSYDDRYSVNQVVDHDGNGMDSVDFKTLEQAEKDGMFDDVDVIGIDEGQFVSDISRASELADKGKVVIVAALDGSFERKPIGDIHLLYCKAEIINKLSAVCRLCGDDACFTDRFAGDELDKSANSIDKGGDEKYRALCRGCYLEVEDLRIGLESIAISPSSEIHAVAEPAVATTVVPSNPLADLLTPKKNRNRSSSEKGRPPVSVAALG